MQPLLLVDDEESPIARLEARVGQLARVMTELRERCEQLEGEARGARVERDSALAELQELAEEVRKSRAENEALRAKQKEAAARVRALLGQFDQLGLFEAQESAKP
jgi:FtsZ-binding cell division protein ZapB